MEEYRPMCRSPSAVSGPHWFLRNSVRRKIKTMKTLNLHLFTALGLAAGITASVAAGPVPGQVINLEFRSSGPALPVDINYVFGEASDSATRSGGSFGYAGFLNWYGGLAERSAFRSRKIFQQVFRLSTRTNIFRTLPIHHQSPAAWARCVRP